VRGRFVLVLAVGLVGAALVGAAAVVALSGDDGEREPSAMRGPDGDPAACRGLRGEGGQECYVREFLAMVRAREDAQAGVQAIADAVRREGGYVLMSCHGLMHTVGRTYARETGVTLATLMEHLPQSNDPGCPAGFAHGMVTAVAGEIDPRRPAEAAEACGEALTRYQRYSCIHGFGHAFMRINGEQVGEALRLCRALGDQAPDCAQGAYHDYWFAVNGTDDAQLSEEPEKDPRRLCGDQPEEFVRPCWYRAFIELRPEGFALSSPEDLEGLCGGLEGLQREACITGGAVIGPPDPAQQLELCAALPVASDAVACVRGTKAQNLLGSENDVYVRLIEGCERFAGAVRPECYRWLGRTLAVLTDGGFARDGCPRLEGAARRECAAGAARMEDALVTFS
jgi:hypothetical protein